MPTEVDFNWDEWNIDWASDLQKNEMWAKIRSGENDPATGEPLFRYPETARDSREPEPEAPKRTRAAKKSDDE